MTAVVRQRPTQAVVDPLLSEREIEVLALVARGLGNVEIGAELFLSVNTVKTHVSRILVKLGAQDRADAARIARARGLIEDPLKRLLVQARAALTLMPPCHVHPGAGDADCRACVRRSAARRVIDEVDARLGRRRG